MPNLRELGRSGVVKSGEARRAKKAMKVVDARERATSLIDPTVDCHATNAPKRVRRLAR